MKFLVRIVRKSQCRIVVIALIMLIAISAIRDFDFRSHFLCF